MKIGLVACASQKLDLPGRARDLYVSPLFKKAAAYCEATYDRWAILSAKYGLVWPYQIIEPYDVTLNTMPVAARRQWARRVADSLPTGNVAFFLHAGRHYTEFLIERAHAEVPLKGLGIGQQLAWYKAQGF